MSTLSSGQATSAGASARERGTPCSLPDGQSRGGPTEVGRGSTVPGPSLVVAPSSAERGGAPVTTSRASGGAAQRGRPRQGPASMRTSSGTCPAAWFPRSGILHAVAAFVSSRLPCFQSITAGVPQALSIRLRTCLRGSACLRKNMCKSC